MPTRDMASTPPRHVMLAGHHLCRREVHGVEAGSAEAIDLHTRHVIAVVGIERCCACNVGTCFADRIDAAKDNVIHKVRIEIVALLDRAERGRGE
jgi:hypothetical protein